MLRTPNKRDRAAKTARSEFSAQLERARREHDTYQRCRTLAKIAHAAPDGDVTRLALEAAKAAEEHHEAFWHVAAVAWPLRALIERGKLGPARKLLVETVAQSASIVHPVSRMDALHMLLQAVWPLPSPERENLLGLLLAACRTAHSWKAGRTMRDTILLLASEDSTRAASLANAMGDGLYKRQTLRRLAEGKTESPREFFYGD